MSLLSHKIEKASKYSHLRSWCHLMFGTVGSFKCQHFCQLIFYQLFNTVIN